MKKIRCDWNVNDFLQLKVIDGSDVIIAAKQNENKSRVRINPDKIRKLRKQLKRALLEIEGEKTEYKPGDSVYLVEGGGEGGDYDKSPSVCCINLSMPVKLIKKQESGRWMLEYETCSGCITTGFAYEKSFGRRV